MHQQSTTSSSMITVSFITLNFLFLGYRCETGYIESLLALHNIKALLVSDDISELSSNFLSAAIAKGLEPVLDDPCP